MSKSIGGAPQKSTWVPEWLGKILDLAKQVNGVAFLIGSVIAAVSGYGLGVTTAKRELVRVYESRLQTDEATLVLLKQEAHRVRGYLQNQESIALAQFTARCTPQKGRTYEPNQKTCTYEANGEIIVDKLPWLEPVDLEKLGEKP